MLWQEPLPIRYRSLSDSDLDQAIAARRKQLGHEVVILGHHYQQDSVVRHADFLGDSFKLSQLAAEKVRQVGARYVVFCGVHFMAESADILTPENVQVILPDLGAGCSMADMAGLDDVVEAWNHLHAVLERRQFRGRVVPVTYMNSSAAIKGFVGDHGGAVCTSSNARKVLEWAYAGGDRPLQAGEQAKVLFLPDQHLGRNTAADLGIDPETGMVLWDPRHPAGDGGAPEEAIVRSRIILWKGHCSVHKLFRPEHIDQARAMDPQVRVIVHPECDRSVVLKADLSGSTEKIMKTIEESPPGSRWAVGTEIHMVNRLARSAAARGIQVKILSDCQCLCTTMYRIDPQHLLWTLDNLAEGRPVNVIRVEPLVRAGAIKSLERMLQITGAPPLTAASR